MTGPALIRIGALLFVALALAATANEFAQEDNAEGKFTPVPPISPKTDALRRCQTLGTGAATDAACLRTWAEERERFLKLYPCADRFELPKQGDAR